MKKLFLFSILISLLFAGYSQITITDQNGIPINNGDERIFNSDGDEANLILSITNNASSLIGLKLKALSITGADGSGLEFCFGTSCYQEISTENIYPLNGEYSIDAGATDNGTHFHHHIHTGDPDVTEYVLKIYEDNNEVNNYVQFTYKYDANYVGINDINSKNSVSIYPNPATDILNIQIPENIKNPELKLTNIIGKTILKTNLNGSKNKLNIKNFPSGIYFVSIISNGSVINTKKLIIK